MNLVITKKQMDAMLVVSLEGRLDAVTARQLEAELSASLDGITNLVFDFGKLEYITSAGLRALLMAHRTLREKGTITVINANEMVREVLELTGFRAILTIE